VQLALGTTPQASSATGTRGARILFTSLAPLFPPSNGHRLRNLGIVTALTRMGHRVTLVSFNDEQSPGPAGHLPGLDTVPVPLPNGQSGWSQWWFRTSSLTSSLPSGVRRLHSIEMQTTIQEYLRREHFDVMICDDVYNLQNLPTDSGVPVLLNKHDLTYEIMERFKQWQPNPLKAAYVALESKKVRHFEQWACSQVAGVLACSTRDALALNHLSPSSRIWVVPNVIDLETYSPTAPEEGMSVLYVGAMDWYPNCDAVEFFISQILPHIEKCEPQVKFVVAGRNPPDKLRRRYASHPNVRFTGAMADLRVEIERAAVCVVPLRIGSGTRLKILEAAAMNKSVVSTHIGAEGLEFVEWRELLLADKPQQFADAVVDLLRDPKRRRALGAAAHTKVTKQYSVEALFAPLTAALAGVAQGKL